MILLMCVKLLSPLEVCLFIHLFYTRQVPTTLPSYQSDSPPAGGGGQKAGVT